MVYMFLANGFEETEATAPLDLLLRVGADVKTVAVGCNGNIVKGAHGITVEADIREDEVTFEDIDMVILPGGLPGATNLDASKVVESVLAYANENDAYLAAICAAPMVLGKRGYLRGKRATCYPGYEGTLEGAIPVPAKVVRDGRFITAVGMGASIEFGLELISALYGKETADKLASAIKF